MCDQTSSESLRAACACVYKGCLDERGPCSCTEPRVAGPDGNVWTTSLEVPTGTELEYKVVHVHHHGVRWESIDNRVLTIPAASAAAIPQQGPQNSIAAGSSGTAELDGPNSATLTAMEVVCAWDLPAPVEIAINVDPQAAVTEPEDASASLQLAIDSSSSSQLVVLESPAQEEPQAATQEPENASADIGGSSTQHAIPEGSLDMEAQADADQQLGSTAGVQAAEAQGKSAADWDPARAGLPEDLTQAVLQQTAVSGLVGSTADRLPVAHPKLLCLAYLCLLLAIELLLDQAAPADPKKIKRLKWRAPG